MFASIVFLKHFLYFLWMIYLDFSFVFILNITGHRLISTEKKIN